MKRQLKTAAAPPVNTSRKAAPSRAAAAAKKKPAPPAPTPRTKPAAKPAPPVAPDLYSSIHALLHTMRIIEQHEEALCSMHDELKRTGRLAAPRRRDLQRLLAELPTDHYQADLEAVRQALSD